MRFGPPTRTLRISPRSLFSIRAASLVSGLAAASANARLSGLLIGAELAATRSFWSTYAVTVIGNGMQAERYVEALNMLGCASSLVAADGRDACRPAGRLREYCEATA